MDLNKRLKTVSWDNNLGTINPTKLDQLQSIMDLWYRQECEAKDKEIQRLQDMINDQQSDIRQYESRLTRLQLTNRVVTRINNRMISDRLAMNNILHEIFTNDHGLRNFYRDEIRYPDLAYEDDNVWFSDSTEVESVRSDQPEDE